MIAHDCPINTPRDWLVKWTLHTGKLRVLLVKFSVG